VKSRRPAFAPSPATRPPRAGPGRRAFTLIELLAVVAIVGVLAALFVPVVSACRAQASKSREIAAARQLMAAFQMAADERRGVFLSLRNNTADSATEGGAKVSNGEAAARWPHHLRPYLGNRFKHALYVNEQAFYYDEVLSGVLPDYTLTIGTSFGFNGLFVGSVAAQNIKDRPVRKLDEAAIPSKLIAFASAQARELNPKSGYFKIDSPVAGWPSADLVSIPSDTALDAAYGHLSYRLGGKAAVIFLDGHVELLSCARLRDMRLWSDQARRQDNPDYRPAF
jgi:prepilin-type N-terminal cleavage/methylation domain-containing protein/prepilin-type processing-associated H-X9-DG protein